MTNDIKYQYQYISFIIRSILFEIYFSTNLFNSNIVMARLNRIRTDVLAILISSKKQNVVRLLAFLRSAVELRTTQVSFT